LHAYQSASTMSFNHSHTYVAPVRLWAVKNQWNGMVEWNIGLTFELKIQIPMK